MKGSVRKEQDAFFRKIRIDSTCHLFYYSELMTSSRDFLGEFEQIVLLALLRLGDDAYGVPVRQEIEKRTNRSIDVGALYSTLDRLEEKGFIRSRFSDSRPERGGRSRRYFKMQAAGLRALERTRVALASMWEGLDLNKI